MSAQLVLLLAALAAGAPAPGRVVADSVPVAAGAAAPGGALHEPVRGASPAAPRALLAAAVPLTLSPRPLVGRSAVAPADTNHPGARRPDPLRKGRRTDLRRPTPPPVQLAPPTRRSPPPAAVPPRTDGEARGAPLTGPPAPRTGFRTTWSSLSPPHPRRSFR